MATATEQVEAPVYPTNKQVGTEIQAWANRREVSQSELAEVLDVHPHTLNRKLRGTAPMGFEEISAMCNRLGVSVSQLMKEAEAHARL